MEKSQLNLGGGLFMVLILRLKKFFTFKNFNNKKLGGNA